jgi:uracil-DNA glycosylase family 4
VFIVSQALAANQLRRSGVNFFDEKGSLGNTGSNLEKFLNLFDRTVYPFQEIILPEGVKIPKCRLGFKSVYNTEITQCYPGKGIKGDRKSTKEEMANCISKNFILEEIEIIRPKLLLLMGCLSRNSFFELVLEEAYPESLTEHIENISNMEIPIKKFKNGIDLLVLPIQHASGANPEFHKMLRNEKLINLIKKSL